MNKKTSFWFSILFWIYGLGFFVFLRFYRTNTERVWGEENWKLVLLCLVGGLAMGLFYYLFLRIEDSPALRSRSYGFFIFFQIIGILILSIIAIVIASLFSLSAGTLTIDEFLPFIFGYLFSWNVAALAFFLITWTTIAGFIRQMMVKVGPRVLGNLLIGKYHNPREENRIFLFLDMKDSTTIAALLGHARYSRLIQDCFRDLTDSVLRYNVEIYQYIGDEAVLTWEPARGIRNANCIRVYYDFINTLNRRADYYRQQYGVVPFFKAGVNAGPVTVSEIGVIKREIAYLSEVLHTAARIQGKCNELREGILISNSLKILLENIPGISFQTMGAVELRGKIEKEEIFAPRLADLPRITYPEKFKALPAD